jgi:hypothetical protein
MGPVAHTPGSARSRRLVITGERKATLRGSTLDLQLTLSGVPDRSWVDAFLQRDQPSLPIEGVSARRPPKIIADTIHWSIGKADLVPAWWYLGRCVDRANAASFQPPTRGRGASGHDEATVVQQRAAE